MFTNIQLLPSGPRDADGSHPETEWRFLNVGEGVARHVFTYVAKYVDTFRDADGNLPPMPAEADWEHDRYAWAMLYPDIPGSLQITRVGDRWELGIIVENKPGQEMHQWVEVLYVLKKVATMEFK